MAASLSAEDRLTDVEQETLLDIADASIVAGLRGEGPQVPRLDGLPESLHRPRGVFVTIEVDGFLNGCIGVVHPRESLATETAHSAWSAAFADPRLPSLRDAGYERLRIEVSVLGPLTPLDATTSAELTRVLHPPEDGLLLAGAGRQAVFLPKVWEKVADPDEFVDRLRQKAGWPADGWPVDAGAFRFTTETFARGTSRTLRS